MSDVDEKKKKSEVTFSKLRFTVVSLRNNDRHAHENGHYVQMSNFVLYYQGNVVEGGNAENPGGKNPAGQGDRGSIEYFGKPPRNGWKVARLQCHTARLQIPQTCYSQLTGNSYTLVTAKDYPIRDPVAWTLEYSEDGSSWQMIDRRDAVDLPYGLFTSYPGWSIPMWLQLPFTSLSRFDATQAQAPQPPPASGGRGKTNTFPFSEFLFSDFLFRV
jgi:hypothetical protein